MTIFLCNMLHLRNLLTFQNGSAINGVTVLNGQPPSLSAPYEGDVDNEKWWWVCCLEFCFCLL